MSICFQIFRRNVKVDASPSPSAEKLAHGAKLQCACADERGRYSAQEIACRLGKNAFVFLCRKVMEACLKTRAIVATRYVALGQVYI